MYTAIDGTHVQIEAPEKSTVDFFDRKKRYSIGCQGVCDGKLKFLAMSAGFPGSLHDSRMLRSTWLFEQAMKEQILTTPVYPISESDNIRPYLVGDATYLIASWLMKPFAVSRNLAAEHQKFNLTLSQARGAIERAFGILKGRWRVLLAKICLEPSYAADVAMAWSVLYSVC